MTNDIELLLIMDEYGHLIYSRCWNGFCEENDINSNLLSSVISALKSLGQEILAVNEEIKQIQFDEHRIVIRELPAVKLFMILVQDRNSEFVKERLSYLQQMTNTLISTNYNDITENGLSNKYLEEFIHSFECSVLYPIYPFKGDSNFQNHLQGCLFYNRYREELIEIINK